MFNAALRCIVRSPGFRYTNPNGSIRFLSISPVQPVHSGLSVLHHRPAIQRDALHPGHVDARRDALHADNVYAIRQRRRVAALHHDDQHKPVSDHGAPGASFRSLPLLLLLTVLFSSSSFLQLHYDRTLQHLPEGVQDVLDYGDDRCLLAVFLRLPTANAFRCLG